MKTKEIIITSFFIFLSLTVYGFFPSNDNFQQVVLMLVFFVLLPILFNRFFLKKELKSFNVNMGDWKKGVLLSIIGVVFSYLICWLLFYVKDKRLQQESTL